MSTNDPLHAELPESLRQRFAALERRLWKIETAEAVSWAASVLALSYLVLFFSDRLWDSPVWFRVTGAGAGAAALALCATRWLKLWVFRRRNLRALAILVQREFSRLGDRLLGIVELSEEQQHSPDFSPALYCAAIQQVATEAERFDFREAANPRRAKRYLAVTAGLLALAGAVVIVLPVAGWNVFLRWAAPLANINRYTLVELGDLPRELIVPHGEPFTVETAVNYRSFWKPSHGVARIERQPWVESNARAGKLSFRLAGQTQRGPLRIKIGDAERELTVAPTHRPSLRDLAANVTLPEYLQLPPSEEPVRGGVFKVLEGSELSFRGTITRELRAAELELDRKPTAYVRLEGDQFTTATVRADALLDCAFSWRDTLGLSNSPALRLIVQPLKDTAPVPQLPDLDREIAMLHSDVLPIRARAQDDFGVRNLGLTWELIASPEENQTATASEIRMDARTRQEKSLERKFQWSPAAHHILPDSVVELVAFARDYLPERERVASAAIRIHVLGNEKHAELIRQRLDSMLARLEDVTRLEEKVVANTDAMLDAAESEPSEQKLEATKNDQERNAEQLQQLAEETAKTLREALKNPLFPEEAMQQWSQNAQAMQELSEKQMKQAADALKAAQENPAARKKQLSAAREQEQEALDTLAKMQSKMGEQLDDLQALTLSQRLRQVGDWQGDIEKELRKIVPQTIGLMPAELPERLTKVNAGLATAQGNAQVESQTLQSEISRFFERTSKTNYGAVSKEMVESKTSEELDRLRGLITENIGMEAAKNSGLWSAKFNGWAEQLAPKEMDSGESEGGEAGAKSSDLTKVLIALLRLRESERVLREQTRLLEQARPEAKDYEPRAGTLTEAQKLATGSLKSLWDANEITELEAPFKESHETMSVVASFLARPQTDAVTDEAHGTAINSLTDLINLINEQAKRKPPSPGEGEGEEEGSSTEAMAFLMQMMSQPGNEPGEALTMTPSGQGNRAGGTTNRRPGETGGDATGKAAPERKVNRAGGASANVPAEFREVLDKYFKALEGK